MADVPQMINRRVSLPPLLAELSQAPERSPGPLAALAGGALAAGLGLGLLVTLAMVLWISSPYPDSGLDGALHVAASLWLLAHGVELLRTGTIEGPPAPVAVTPLLLVVVPLWLAYRAAHDAASPEPAGDGNPRTAQRPAAGPAGTGTGVPEPGTGWPSPGAAWWGVMTGYLLVAAATAAYANGGTLRPVWASAGVRLPLLLGAAVTAGVWRARSGLRATRPARAHRTARNRTAHGTRLGALGPRSRRKRGTSPAPARSPLTVGRGAIVLRRTARTRAAQQVDRGADAPVTASGAGPADAPAEAASRPVADPGTGEAFATEEGTEPGGPPVTDGPPHAGAGGADSRVPGGGTGGGVPGSGESAGESSEESPRGSADSSEGNSNAGGETARAGTGAWASRAGAKGARAGRNAAAAVAEPSESAMARRRFRATVRAALTATSVLIAGGALLVLIPLLHQQQGVRTAFQHFAQDNTGRAAVVLLALALLPNAAVWGASFALGPGFLLGTSHLIAPLGVAHVTLLPGAPRLPVLPAEGYGAPFTWAVGVLPIAAGLALAWRTADAAAPAYGERADAWSRGRTALVAMGAAVLCGALTAALCALAGGPMGAHELARFGPVWWQPGVAATVWTLLVGTPGVLVLRAWRVRGRGGAA